MTAIFRTFIYGVVQGLTEFLPVSSSGHLVIARHYLGIEDAGITMEVLTHAATALAAIIFMRRRIVEILAAAFRALRVGYRGLDEPGREDLRLLAMLAVATLPAVIAGLLVRSHIEGFFSDVPGTARMLLVTGAFVYVTGLLGGGTRSIGLPRALAVGVAQACAILPGLSRSGLTVGTGLALRVKRRRAIEFALLLSIPVILGATAFEFMGGRIGGSASHLAVAFVAALASGYLAISLLFRSVVNNRFHMFAYYLVPAGILLLILN